MFIPRTERPEKGNKYYIRKANGGYSNAILGSPTDPACNVLCNCVGYAVGRFSEIAGDTSMHYLKPVNAEQFIQYMDKSLVVGQTPKLGACMVWQKGATLKSDDGCGHVAIVEQLNPDGSIITSESEYNGRAWLLKVRKNDGYWGQKGYKFLGFIYNPAVEDMPKGVNTLDFKLDGQKASIWATMIEGHNYVRIDQLDDLGIVKEVKWNSKTKEVEVTT